MPDDRGGATEGPKLIHEAGYRYERRRPERLSYFTLFRSGLKIGLEQARLLF